VPGTLKHIRIHVSSPADVQAEREALAKVVDQLNQDVARKAGFSLELVRWEDSAAPAMGGPQDVINRQIPATDVFVGILWSRFGTPVLETSSGTEHELQLALDSWQLLGRPRVLMYFCERPISLSQVDPQQIAKVQEFRKSIAEHQLIATYTDVAEFEHRVRRDLAAVLQDLERQGRPARRPPRLFYSYAHEDGGLREELAKHLKVLERNQVIESWYDNMIAPGTNWSDAVSQELEKADIVVLLISSDFLDSDYCYTIEMKRALERHEAGTMSVVPIIVRSALWEESPLAKLKALPKDGRPVTLWDDRDEAWTDVARGIRGIAHAIQR
jgi:hypothetical protein